MILNNLFLKTNEWIFPHLSIYILTLSLLAWVAWAGLAARCAHSDPSEQRSGWSWRKSVVTSGFA